MNRVPARYSPSWVSIPYRYATNNIKHLVCYFYSYLFQFLIGTLQTDYWRTGTENRSKVSIPYRYATNGIAKRVGTRRWVVSIPYRYATNTRHLWLVCRGSMVSIPYRYATNHGSVIDFVMQLLFQFLIGTLQTHTQDRNPRLRV